MSGRMLRQRISLRTPNPWDHDEAGITALKATTLCCRRKIRKAWDVLLHSAPFYSETPLFRDSLLEKNINSASLSISRQRWLTSETTGNEKTSRRSDSEQSSQLLAGAQPSSPAAQQPSSPAAQQPSLYPSITFLTCGHGTVQEHFVSGSERSEGGQGDAPKTRLETGSCHGMAHAIRWHDLSHNIVLLCIIMIYYVLSWDIHASSPSSLELSSIHPSGCWLGEPWPGCMHSSLETAFALWAPRTCGTPHGGFPLHHSTDFQHSEQWQSHSTQKDLAKHLG